MKAMVHSPDSDTDFFDIVTRVLQGEILAPYLFIIWQVNVQWMSIDLIKENGFTLKMTRNRQYPTETMTDANYADDLVLLKNTAAQVESLQHSLVQAARNIGLYMNVDKTEDKCFWQDGATFTLSSKLMKLVDLFTYVGNNISSTESDVNIHLEKSQSYVSVGTIAWFHQLYSIEMHGKKLDGNYRMFPVVLNRS